jgi:actin-related protein
MAAAPTFKEEDMISQEDYDEFGPSIVHQKCVQ